MIANERVILVNETMQRRKCCLGKQEFLNKVSKTKENYKKWTVEEYIMELRNQN